MNKNSFVHALRLVLALMLAGLGSMAQATINGVTGTNFSITAAEDRLSTADGNSLHFWGFGLTGGITQYPGPTLIVNQGDTVTITLNNTLPEPVSIIFPGQELTSASGNGTGLLTAEAAAQNGTAVYTFVAGKPGTYMYQSGTNMDKQLEMGLIGALIVRPAQPGWAYEHADSRYDREYLYLMSEMDIDIHQRVEFNQPINTNNYYPTYWFINGRTAVDTLFPANSFWLPTQPYNILPLMHPGERVLLRVISAGHDAHPLHPHGNNFTLIARDGRLLSSAPGQGADLAYSDYNLNAQPGATYDFVFEWTGKGMGWDFYGHAPGDPLEPAEDPTFHGVALKDKVSLPDVQDVVIGGFYSGSPFLGQNGELPPGEGGLNGFDGFFYPWHSHHEKELTNFNIFPGGLLTFMAVVPWGFAID